MKAVLPAGGLGTRHPEKADERPKRVVEIGGTPIREAHWARRDNVSPVNQ